MQAQRLLFVSQAVVEPVRTSVVLDPLLLGLDEREVAIGVSIRRRIFMLMAVAVEPSELRQARVNRSKGESTGHEFIR